MNKTFIKQNWLKIVVVVIVIVLVSLTSTFLVHSKCKGNEGIPWWPNSGCDCKGLLIPGNEQKNVVGAGASYCIGILREYEANTNEPTIGNTGNAQIANPASVNCIEKGGKLSIVDKPEGQVGMCTLSNGTVCEEWAYFRGECRGS